MDGHTVARSPPSATPLTVVAVAVPEGAGVDAVRPSPRSPADSLAMGLNELPRFLTESSAEAGVVLRSSAPGTPDTARLALPPLRALSAL